MGGKNLVGHWCSRAKLIERASNPKAPSTENFKSLWGGEDQEERGYTRLRSVYDCFSSFHVKIKQTAFLNMTTLLKMGWPHEGTTLLPLLGNYCSCILTKELFDNPTIHFR